MNAEAKKAPRRGIVRALLVMLRVVKWTLIVVIVLLLVIRASLPWLVPFAAKKGGEPLGLDIQLDDFTLSVWKGDVSIGGLLVHAKPDQGVSTTEPLVALRRLSADIGMRDLVDGVVRVHFVEVDGLEVGIERRADGSIALPKALTEKSPDAAPPATTEEPPAATAEEPEAEPEGPLDFTLPVQVDRISVSNLRARVRDGAVSPPLDKTLELDLDLADLGVPGKPFSFELRAAIPALIDAFRIGIDGSVEGPRASARVDVHLDGLALAPLEPYLKDAGVEALASQLDFDVTIDAAVDATSRPANELGATLAVDGLALRSDLAEAFAIDRFDVQVDRISDAAIVVAKVALDGLRGGATKNADGSLLAAGFRIGAPATPSDESAPRADAKTESAPTDPEPRVTADPVATSPAKPAPVISVSAIDLKDLRFAFRDESMSPPLSVEPRVVALSTRDLVLDDKAAERPLSLDLALALPGFLERLQVTAQSAVEGGARTFDVELVASGVNAVAFEPWIAPSGIEPTMRAGELTLRTSGRLEPAMGAPTRIDARIVGVRLVEGVELFGLDGLVVEGVSLGESEIAIAAISLDNPRVIVKREADGSLRVPAIRIPAKPAPSGEGAVAATAAPDAAGGSTSESDPATSDPQSPAPPADPAAAAPTFSLARLRWQNAALRFEDEAVAEPRTFTLKDVDLAVEGVRVTARGLEQPVKLTLAAAVDGLLTSLTLDAQATAVTAGDDLDASANLSFALAGLDMDALAPYTAGAPVDPTFRAADFRVKAVALAKKRGDDLSAGVEVTDLALTDGTNPLFGVARLAIDDAKISPTQIEVGAVELSGVRLGAERLADGGLIACGIALAAPSAAGPSDANAVAKSAPAASTPAAAETPVAPTDAAVAETPALKIRLNRIAVDDVRVGWKDSAVTPAVDTSLVAALGIEGLELGEAPPAARFGVGLTLEGAMDRLTLEGTVVPNPDDLRLSANLAILGLRPDAVAGYLAAAPEITLRDGRLAMTLEARLAKALAGGQDASLALRSFSYRDGEQDPFLAFDELAIVAPRLDAENGVFQVTKIGLAGFETHAEKTAEGGMKLLGIALAAPAVAQAEAAALAEAAELTEAAALAEAAARAEAAATAPAPADGAAAKPAPSAAPASGESFVAPQKALSLLAQIDDVDIELKKVTFIDGTRPGAPFQVGLRLKSEGPIVIDSNERSEAAPPILFALAARLDPLGTDLLLRLQAEPLAAEPMVRANFDLRGIDATKLAELVPGVFDTRQPPRITEGVFTGSAEARLVFRRRGPLDFDVSRGFGALLQLSDIAFRERPDGVILAGLDGLRASVKTMAPATGDIHLDQLEITTPRLSIVKRAEHTEIAGLRFPVPAAPVPLDPAAAQDAPAPAPEQAAPPVAAGEPASTTPPAPKPEIRVDEILVHGIAVDIVDETVNPPLALPLETLEVEIRNVTTRALEQPVPIRFNITLGAGPVELPVRKAAEPLVPSVANLAGDVTALGSGALDAGLDVGKGALDVGKGALGAGAEGVEKIGGALGDALGGALGGIGLGKDKAEREKEEQEKANQEAEEQKEAAARDEASASESAPVLGADGLPLPAAAEPLVTEPAPPEPEALEKRDLFDEIELKGQLVLVPVMKGNVDLRISAFELLGVKGIAESAGVKISEGLLDLGVQTRFLGADGIGINTVTSFENLSLTEPSDGPISRYLQLPAPLDVVVFALRDEEGVMRIPLRVAIKPENISITGILGAVTATLAEMIGRAIAHSPLRAVGTVGDIGGAAMGAVGLGDVGLDTVGLDKGLSAIGLGGDESPAAEARTELSFGVADAVIDLAVRDQVALIARTLANEPETKLVLSHRLTRLDVERAKTLVNPGRAAIDEIVLGLKRRRAELTARRESLTAELRVRFVYGDPWSSREPAIALREVLDELGRIEDALDDLYDLTAPEAERRRDTRARAGSLAVAAQRLAEVRRAVLLAGGSELADRIEVQSPRFVIDPAPQGAVIAELKRVR